MLRVEVVVEQVLTAVRESSSYGNTVEEIDRVYLSLIHSSAALGQNLNSSIQEINVQHELVVQLQELHSCVDNLMLEWELNISGSFSALQSPGRGKKPINIPMVS